MSAHDEKTKGPHLHFSRNREAAKRFIDQLALEPMPGVSSYMSDKVFFIEAYRGKAKYSWPIEFHQPAAEMEKDVAAALRHCREFAEHNKKQGDKNEMV